MKKGDWRWWDRLAADDPEGENAWSHYQAWETLMREHVSDEWFDEVEFVDRAALYAAMVDLRDTTRKEGAKP